MGEVSFSKSPELEAILEKLPPAQRKATERFLARALSRCEVGKPKSDANADGAKNEHQLLRKGQQR